MTLTPGSDQDRLLAGLGYPIWPIAIVVLLTDLKRSAFLRYHAIQSVGLGLGYVVVAIALAIITSMPGLWWLGMLTWWIGLVWLILALVYGYRAYQGQTFTIPVVSDLVARYQQT